MMIVIVIVIVIEIITMIVHTSTKPNREKEKVLYQSCHILHKQGKYYIVHFKELFALDGKPSNISENDIQRRNAIAVLLEEWGLVKIINPNILTDNIAPLHQIKIISFKEKDEWDLIAKYNIGKKINDY